MHRHVRLPVLLSLLSIVFCSTAHAHRVNVFAYEEDGKIITDCYFQNGGKCRQSKITVFDGEEKKLLEGTTDNEGMFVFEIPKKDNLHIVLDAGSGHRAEYTIPREELIGEDAPAKHLPPIESTDEATESESPVSHRQIELMVDNTVNRKLSAIIREQQRVRFKDIISGIGYIVGIMGIIAYFKSKSVN